MNSSDATSVLFRLDQICNLFETELKNGRRPQIGDYLDAATVDRQKLLRELLLLDCAYTRVNGQIPDREQYLASFPDDDDLIDAAIKASRFFARSSESGTTASYGTVPIEIESAGLESMPVRIGMTVGKYRVRSLIGSGGMGTVFLAAHTLIDLTVALKVMQPRLLKRPSARQRFLQEAQAAVLLQHPNIVLTRDVGEDRGLLFLTMEVLDGENLSDRVKRLGPLAPEQVLQVLEQVTDGLGYAHEHGIVHRDVKPHNLMMLRDAAGTVKILDLGLARFINDAAATSGENVGGMDVTTVGSEESRLTGTGSVVGTYAYMAPEQATDAHSADARSDMFSLGCTAYYLLTGMPPFEKSPIEHRDDKVQVAESHAVVRTRKYESLETKIANAPPEYLRLIQRMMAVEPADRFATMAELGRELLVIRRRYFSRGWTPNADDPDGLRKALLAAQLVESETLAKVAARNRRTTMTGDEVEPTNREDAFELLRLLGRMANGGLSQFQVEQILTGKMDRLQLPCHILVDQLNTGWKGDVFRGRRTAAPDGFKGDAATIIGRTETVRIIPFKRLCHLEDSTVDLPVSVKQYVDRLVQMSKCAGAAQIFDAKLYEGSVVIAGEFVDGPLLSVYADRELRSVPSTLKPLLQLMIEMCVGIRHIHAEGMLHLDLSPDRWVVRPNGRVVLIDWGLANLLMTRRADDRPGGTPPIVAPEMVDRWELASAAADVFALGHVFRFLRSGKFPFRSSRVFDETKNSATQTGSIDWNPKQVLGDSVDSVEWRSSSLSRRGESARKASLASASSLAERLDDLISRMIAIDPSSRPSLEAVESELLELQRSSTFGGTCLIWLKRTANVFRRRK